MTVTSLPPAGGAELEVLLERLKACPATTDALDSFGGALKPREQRGLISALLRRDRELSARIGLALRNHTDRSCVFPLWQMWQKIPTDAVCLDLVRRSVEKHGLGGLMDPTWIPVVSHWIAQDPVEAILMWANEEKLKLDDLPTVAKSPLVADSPLMDEVWRALLISGSGQQLMREFPRKLQERWLALGPEDAMSFGQNYLGCVPRSAWYRSILTEIRSRYGMPNARDSRSAFWRPIADEVKRQFHKLLLGWDLREALGGDSERHRYWQRWIDQLRDMELGSAGATGYAVLEFEKFGVIEFFEHGNAAYVYDIDALNRLRATAPRHPKDLKDGRYCRRRLIHRAGWQVEADSLIQRLLR